MSTVPVFVVQGAVAGMLAVQIALAAVRARCAPRRGEAVWFLLLLAAVLGLAATGARGPGGLVVAAVAAWAAGACLAAHAGEAPSRRWHAAAVVVAAAIATCAWAGWWGGWRWLAPAAGVAALAAGALRRWRAGRHRGAAGDLLCAIGLLPVAGALVDQAGQLALGAPLSVALAGAGAAALGSGYLLAELDYLRAPARSSGGGRGPDSDAEGLLQQRLAITGYLTAGVAHEFKNTLGHIKTTAEWGAAGGDAQRALELIRSHVGDGVSGVNEMLTTTLRDGPEARSRVSLLNEINKILGVVASTLQTVRITIRLRVPAELALVTRRSELMLALLNLIHNAGQATSERSPGGGAVTVTGRAEADRCILEVTDGAGGVDPSAVGRLFERGYGTGAGSGVGLHLARLLVERNDGSLTYHPIPGGSCFRIALPMAPSPAGVGAVRGGERRG